MSILEGNQVQVGNSATALNNLVIVPDGAGGVSIQQGVIGGGSNRTVLTIDASGQIEYPARVESMVRLNTSNGYGSTATKIRRYTTTVENLGTDITYADSATDGASFTINTSGVYSVSMCENYAATNTFGASKDSNQLTTAIGSITDSTRIAHGLSTGSATGTCAATLYLAAGSVIRPHCAGSANVTAVNAQFTITRVA